MYELYKLNANYVIGSSKKNANINNIFVQVCKPSIFGICIPGYNQSLKNQLVNLYWYLITLGGYRIYYVCDGDIVVHTSYCITKCYKFPYKKSNDIYIGPCFTHINYRGKGIYPFVISKIIKDYSKTNNDFYMIVHAKNTSSQRGINKVGFRKTAKLKYNNLLKFYSINREKS